MPYSNDTNRGYNININNVKIVDKLCYQIMTSSPALQTSTRSSSRMTHSERGMVPMVRRCTCSWTFTSW